MFVVYLALLILNLTSSFCSGVHVVEFCDLNILPRYGCWEINLVPSKVVCPIFAVNILNSSEFAIAQIEYSVLFATNTGLGNLKLVAVEASSEILISPVSTDFWAKGKTSLVGYPLTIVRIWTVAGNELDFVLKNKSTLVI